MILSKQSQQVAIKATIEAGLRTLDFYGKEIEIHTKEDNSPLTQADLESNRIIISYLSKTDYPILSEEIENSAYEERRNWKVFWLVDPIDGTKEFIKTGRDYTINIALIENSKPIFGCVYAPVRDSLYIGMDENSTIKIEKASGLLNADLEEIIAASLALPIMNNRNTFKVVASKSHLNEETTNYVEELKSKVSNVELCSYGSSLKLCMLAEGSADLYPRIGPTMEWDTGAGHAVLNGAGGFIHKYPEGTKMVYNKENLLNPFFVAYSKGAGKLLNVER